MPTSSIGECNATTATNLSYSSVCRSLPSLLSHMDRQASLLLSPHSASLSMANLNSSRSSSKVYTVGSPASPRSRSSSCSHRLPRAQAWPSLPFKPLWAKPSPNSPLCTKRRAHIRRRQRAVLAGSIRSTSGGVPTLNIFPCQSFGGSTLLPPDLRLLLEPEPRS